MDDLIKANDCRSSLPWKWFFLIYIHVLQELHEEDESQVQTGVSDHEEKKESKPSAHFPEDNICSGSELWCTEPAEPAASNLWWSWVRL